MSYDYTLVKGSAGVTLEAFVEGAMSETVGAVEAVKIQISRLFPQVQWQTIPPGPELKMSVWFGLGGPADFQLLVEPDGQVRMITMSNCERSEVELVANELGLSVMDDQSLEQFPIREDGDG
jgi:hypothetical protein